MNQETHVVEEMSNGITVTKRLDEENYTHPAITYTLTSERDDETAVRLVDAPPEEVRPEQLGFHSGYGSEHWEFADGKLVFEYEVEPDEEFTTVVGIRDVDDVNVERFLTEFVELSVGRDAEADATLAEGHIPELEESEPSSPDGDGRSDTPAAEADDAPALNLESDGRDGTFTRGGGGSRPRAGEADESFTRGGAGASTSTTATDDDGGTAQDHDPAGSSTEAKIRQLQADVADMRAYTAALEDFLDEHGSAEQIVGRFEDRLDELEGELERIDATVETNQTAVAELDDDVSAVDDGISRLDDEVDENASDIEAIDDRLDDAEELLADVGDLSELDDRLSDLRTSVEDIETWRERMRDVFAE